MFRLLFLAPARDLLADKVKTVVGFARLFRPRYARANLGHPSYPSGLAMRQTPQPAYDRVGESGPPKPEWLVSISSNNTFDGLTGK
jgi:hypothetical protein